MPAPWVSVTAYAGLMGSILVWRILEAEQAADALVASAAESKAAQLANATKPALWNNSNATALAATDDEESRHQVILGILAESQLSVFILFNFICSLYALVAFAVKGLFFGNLSVLEAHKLTERAIKYISFKVVFVGAYVSPDIVSVTAWFTWFAVLGFVKMFVGLTKDRFEGLMSAPVARFSAHAKTFTLLVMLLISTAWWSWVVCTQLYTGATSELFLLMFECVLIVIDATQTLVRYIIHILEAWRQMRADAAEADADPSQGHHDGAHSAWEWQGTVVYYTELIADLLTLSMTLCHYCHIWYLHGFGFQLIDGILFLNIRAVSLSLKNRFCGFQRYLAASHNVCTIFPNAQPSELHGENAESCAICREPMVVAKRLPCGHMFHRHCLRAWLQQSGSDNFTCPICRAPLFLKPQDEANAGARGGPADAADGPGVPRLLRSIVALLPDSLAMSDVETEMHEMQWAAEVREFVIQDLEENFGGHFGGVEEPVSPTTSGRSMSDDSLPTTTSSMPTTNPSNDKGSQDGSGENDGDDATSDPASESLESKGAEGKAQSPAEDRRRRRRAASVSVSVSESLRSISQGIAAVGASVASAVAGQGRSQAAREAEDAEAGEEAESSPGSVVVNAAAESRKDDSPPICRRSARLAARAVP